MARPPKNEQQFKGYKPRPAARQKSARGRRWFERGWVMWLILIGLAAGLVGLKAL